MNAPNRVPGYAIKFAIHVHHPAVSTYLSLIGTFISVPSLVFFYFIKIPTPGVTPLFPPF
jgi:hypothetical protein